MPKNRISHCPSCGGSGQQRKDVQSVRKNRRGDDETYTETTYVDCSVCDGSGSVVDWS